MSDCEQPAISVDLPCSAQVDSVGALCLRNSSRDAGGTKLELALDEMALLMTPTRHLQIQQNMRD